MCCDRDCDRDAQISLFSIIQSIHPHGVPSKSWLSHVWDRGKRGHISVGFLSPDIKYPIATRYSVERW